MILANNIIQSFSESIFTQMTKLANQYQAVNLAQGFPDFDGPRYGFDYVFESLNSGKNQYAPSMGLPVLRDSIAKLYAENYKLKFDYQNEILITNGATEAIYLSVMALLNPGDEVILIEPFYDSYLASLKMAKVNVKVLTLTEDKFEIDFEKLKKLLSDKTKMLIFNNPHNPSGKVFTKDELKELAQMVSQYNLIVLSDEVYEYITYKNAKHIPLASFEEIKDKVITISSIGKTYSFTGWKIGWAVGPAKYIDSLHKLHQFITFCVATPLQDATAKILNHFSDYVGEFQSMYSNKKNRLLTGLQKLGLNALEPQGSYFLLVKLAKDQDSSIVAQDFIKKLKVASIPLKSFYLESDLGKKYLRFCFAKNDTTLDHALKNLEENL